MKSLQEKRKDALMRMLRYQQRDESRLMDARQDLEAMDRRGPKDDHIRVKYGVLAGFTCGDVRDALKSRIESLLRITQKRDKEIRYLKRLIEDRESRGRILA